MPLTPNHPIRQKRVDGWIQMGPMRYKVLHSPIAFIQLKTSFLKDSLLGAKYDKVLQLGIKLPK